MADTSANPPPGLPNHDNLAKVWSLVTMCQDNFKLTYKPGQNISIDESTLAYKGRVKLLQYSKNKPNRFHIKLFMGSEPDTGYICGFSIYTGRASNELLVDKSTVYVLWIWWRPTVQFLPTNSFSWRILVPYWLANQ